MIGMKIQCFKALCFGLTLGTLIQTVDAATIPTVSIDRQSPIEKALTQQKQQRSNESRLMIDNDQIRVLNSLKSAPTQNFLAEQHQRFSRFVQAFSHNLAVNMKS